MTRIFSNAAYDFIGFRKKAILATIVVLVLGLGALGVLGLNQSIEFTGGTLIQVKLAQPGNVAQMRSDLEQAGIQSPEIATFGSDRDFVIRARTTASGTDPDNVAKTTDLVTNALKIQAGVDSVIRSEGVGPKVGGELRTKAFLAIFLSFFAVLGYLAIRFEWRFGLAAVIATFHDIVLTICFIAIARLEVSLVVVAAVLSMVGYSLNDTIIIFDRVRENLRKNRRDQLIPVLNRSINETLPRSVLTHFTTLATLTALTVFGGQVIRPFALVMLFGVFTGTFSSIFIAAPALLIIEQKWPGVDGRGVRSGARKPPVRGKPQTA
jgi:preprotein translocase subunit SecF